MTRVDLEAEGFTPVDSVGALRVGRRRAHLPLQPGVYAVIAAPGAPQFAKVNAGHPLATVDAAVLQEAWVGDSDIVYIGCTTRPLKERIRELVRHGLGRADNHSGGEWLWQLEGIEQAVLLAAAVRDPAAAKQALLTRFRAEHAGRLPFANRLDAPSR